MENSDDENEEAFLLDLLSGAALPEDPEGGVTSTSWAPVEGFDTIITVDDVDVSLLAIARAELAVVANRLMRRMFGQQTRVKKNVTPTQLLKVFLSPQIMSTITAQINSNIVGSSLQQHELTNFIQVELTLSFYGITPTRFFDTANKELYPTQGRAMNALRYETILKALSKSSKSYVASGNWNPPYEHERMLASMMEQVRVICSEIGFVKETSILSLDDDLLRLRSQLVQSTGLSHTNNPAKGLGVVHHGIVSATTDLYLGGHIASRGESTEDCVKILLRSLCGVSAESQIHVPNLLAYDRGYGGPGRTRFFTDLELIASRLDKTKNHTVISQTGTRRQCIMCCRLNHNPAAGAVCQSRQGFKVTTRCSECEVSLCNIIRHDGKTCFELFHELEEANNPCDSSRSPARVKRAAHNQSLPPSRRRNIGDEPNPRATSRA